MKLFFGQGTALASDVDPVHPAVRPGDLSMKRLSQHIVNSLTSKSTMNSSNELPMELWMLIASYLPKGDVQKLMSVNRALYEVAMDAKYGLVEFGETDPWKFVHTAEGLQNPSIAQRARTLVIWPEAVRAAIEQTKPTTKNISKYIIQRARKRKPRFVPAFVHALVSRPTVYCSRETNLDVIPPPDLSPSQRKQLYLRALEMVSRVTRIEVHWTVDTHFCQHQSAIVEVTEIWGLLPLSTLRSLTLAMEASSFTKFDTLKILESLRTLNLQLHVSSASAKDTPMDVLVSLINSTGNSLEQLVLTIWGHHSDLSPILNGIRLPNLRSLSLRLPFDATHIKDSTCFTTLLSRHQLTDLVLRAVDCRDSLLRDPAYSEWLNQTFKVLHEGTGKPMRFFGVTSLHIGIKRARLGPLLAGTFPNVEDVTFSNVAFRYEDLKATLVPFANRSLRSGGNAGDTITGYGHGHGLKKLSLFVETLTPELMLLLAEQCPQLQYLMMHVDIILESTVVLALRGRGSTIMQGFVNSVLKLEFTNQPGAAMLQQWKLEELAIVQMVYNVGRRYCWECMEAISKCVPAVKSFAGQGSLKVDKDLMPEAVPFC
ncbi:hypothetical protein BDN72DRAFT_107037 [Pluteus cervinus]|uniref:Uncharacterized protein n=1 Tax=Pluteus cervinus TaxID=181527 RepID=A0ACD3ANL1_9AGAR|nr:hypothetical protein BDN72DRAFT_107037 [Pluteus cervinus]